MTLSTTKKGLCKKGKLTGKTGPGGISLEIKCPINGLVVRINCGPHCEGWAPRKPVNAYTPNPRPAGNCGGCGRSVVYR